MESHLNRITAIPGLCNGKPTIRGKGLTVHTLLSHLAAVETESEIFESFPFLEKEDIMATLEYAAYAPTKSPPVGETFYSRYNLQ